MFSPYAGLLALLVGFGSYRYGKFRRDTGSPVTRREQVRMILLGWAIGFPALMIPTGLSSVGGMTPADRIAFILATVGLGLVPLAVVLCFAGALRLVRLYVAHAHAKAESRPQGGPWEDPAASP